MVAQDALVYLVASALAGVGLATTQIQGLAALAPMYFHFVMGMPFFGVCWRRSPAGRSCWAAAWVFSGLFLFEAGLLL